MKWLLRSIPLIALVYLSCTTTTNNYFTNSYTPTITGFSPDTVWTGKTLTIYGTNFGYTYDVRVLLDTGRADVIDDEDTMMRVLVPEDAQTGFIHVWSNEQTATSAKPVVVNYTFHPHTINDTVSDGASFSIPGIGMNNYHGLLRLFVGGKLFPIDSVFPDRIVSHVITGSLSGAITMSDSIGSYSLGTLTVTVPSAWTTLSQIYNYLNVTETHHLTGYTNGPPNTIDSTWTTKASYHGQHDTNIAGVEFVRTSQGLQYTVQSIQYDNEPLFQIVWNLGSQTAVVYFEKYSYAPQTLTHILDTVWYSNSGQNLPAPLPVDNDIEFVIPGIYYYIQDDSTDTQGLVNLQETTGGTVTSGEFDIVLKH